MYVEARIHSRRHIRIGWPSTCGAFGAGTSGDATRNLPTTFRPGLSLEGAVARIGRSCQGEGVALLSTSARAVSRDTYRAPYVFHRRSLAQSARVQVLHT